MTASKYTVRVREDNGCFEGNIAAGGPPSTETARMPQASAPAKVTGVGVAAGVESLTVSWTSVTGASGYKVQWKSGSQGYDSAGRQDTAAGTSHTITGLTAGTVYTVRVIATKTNAPDGAPSDEATGTPEAPPLPRPDRPDVIPGVGFLAVSWNAVAGADGYKVQWKSGGQGYDPAARQAAAAGTSHTIPSLTAGTVYTVRIIATRTGADDGPPSDEATGAPLTGVEVSITGNAAADEGEAAEFPVRMNGLSTVAVTLSWTMEEGTAREGEDYRAVTAGSLTLRPGERTGTLRVRTLEDRHIEPAETFRVRLTGATNADVDPRAASRTGTITDDDTEPARARALGTVLAGVGRWIAGDAADVVEGRFTRRPAVAQAQVTLDGPAPTRAAAGRRPSRVNQSAWRYRGAPPARADMGTTSAP